MKHTNLHYGQIPTSRKAIKNEIFKSGSSAILSLLKCFRYDINSNGYLNQVLITANYLERISRLVYKGHDGKYKKLPEKTYRRDIFEGYAETPQEVSERMNTQGMTQVKAERIFKKIWQTADLVCPMIACIEEQAFVTEYAYAIDYTIRHTADLPKPNITCLFPENYPDYQYGENFLTKKIAAYMPI